LTQFAKRHELKLITVKDLIAYRMRTEKLVKRIAEFDLPTTLGTWKGHAYENALDGNTHIALVMGEIGDGRDLLVRVHSECLTGDALHSVRCDCAAQRDGAMSVIAKEGRGVFLYLRQEGRGIGLMAKLQAYELQDAGLDTVEANERLGFKADNRDFALPGEILKALGVSQVRLLSNNPDKVDALTQSGIEVVERVPCEVAPSPHAEEYLKTKKEKLGHLFGS